MESTGRLLARLLPFLVPLAACGGSTSDPGTGSATTGAGGATSTQGAGGTGTGGTGVGGGQGPGGSGNGGTQGPGAGGAQGPGVGGNTQGPGAGGSAGGGPGAGGAHGGSPIACADTPLLPDANTGFLVCQGTEVHRPSVGMCPSHLPMSGNPCEGVPGNGCHAATDCTMSPHGYCDVNGGGALICSCHYGCVQDSECAAGSLCLCGTDIGTCVTTTCTTDSDCPGQLCLSYSIPSGCSATSGFACTTPGDQCLTDDDCGAGGGPQHPVCSHDGAKRVCKPGPGLCGGRPLIVDDDARVAGLRRGASSWC